MEPEALRADDARLSEAVKELAIELALVGEIDLGLMSGQVPPRVDGVVKEGLCKRRRRRRRP